MKLENKTKNKKIEVKEVIERKEGKIDVIDLNEVIIRFISFNSQISSK